VNPLSAASVVMGETVGAIGGGGRWKSTDSRTETPRRPLDRDSDAGPRAELAVLADPERRVAESRLYRVEVDQAFGAVNDAHTHSLPELRAIRARRVEVFDRIEATQAPAYA
jgi:hypothetical protein